MSYGQDIITCIIYEYGEKVNVQAEKFNRMTRNDCASTLVCAIIGKMTVCAPKQDRSDFIRLETVAKIMKNAWKSDQAEIH
jgi:hypothetical protein